MDKFRYARIFHWILIYIQTWSSCDRFDTGIHNRQVSVSESQQNKRYISGGSMVLGSGKDEVLFWDSWHQWILTEWCVPCWCQHSNVLVDRGGIELTVRGQNLDNVAEPIMVVVVIVDGNVFTFYQVHLVSEQFCFTKCFVVCLWTTEKYLCLSWLVFQACDVVSSTQMICPTPDLSGRLPGVLETNSMSSESCEHEMKFHQFADDEQVWDDLGNCFLCCCILRKTKYTLNVQQWSFQGAMIDSGEDVEIYIQFILDGIQTELPEGNAQSLEVTNSPQIYSNVTTVEFNVHPPCSEQLIVIQVHACTSCSWYLWVRLCFFRIQTYFICLCVCLSSCAFLIWTTMLFSIGCSSGLKSAWNFHFWSVYCDGWRWALFRCQSFFKHNCMQTTTWKASKTHSCQGEHSKYVSVLRLPNARATKLHIVYSCWFSGYNWHRMPDIYRLHFGLWRPIGLQTCSLHHNCMWSRSAVYHCDTVHIS